MNSGRMIFTQIMNIMPRKTFHRCVARYQGDFSVKQFSCLEQFRVMAFAQLNYRESLYDTVTCLRARNSKLYRMGIRSKVSKSTEQMAVTQMKARNGSTMLSGIDQPSRSHDRCSSCSRK
jgi:hypothetical protein